MDWFRVGEVEPGVHLVAEPGHVASWLIHGSDRDVLLDTGLGVADIAAAVAAVATAPVEVVSSHHHFDHVGGNHRFARVSVHELGPPLLARGVPAGWLEAYDETARGIHAAWSALCAADEAGFHLLGPDEEVRPWPPPGFDAARWRIAPPEPTALLSDGDLLDLGGRSLRVLHAPGHAPDHICLLDEHAGILFAQDMCYYGPHLLNVPDADLVQWTASLRRLADEVAADVRTVYGGHCLRTAYPPRTLAELAAAGERLLAGGIDVGEGPGFLGLPARIADFGHFAIHLPPGAGG